MYYLQSGVLEEYVIVSQHVARMESLFRQADGTWSLAFFEGRDDGGVVARVRSLEIDLPLSEVYAKVELSVAVENEGLIYP